MIEKYIISSRSQYANYKPVIIFVIFLILGYFYGIYRDGDDAKFFYIDGLVIVFIIQVIPLWLLHMNYYSANKGDELICDFQSHYISYNHEHSIIDFKSYEIKSIKLFMSFPSRNKKLSLLVWDNYNYCDILLLDDRRIIITSLLVPDMDTFLEKMNIDKDKISITAGFFSSIDKSEKKGNDINLFF